MDLVVEISPEPVAPPCEPFSHFQTPAYDALLRVYGQVPLWFVARERSSTRPVGTWLLFETPGNYLAPPDNPIARRLDLHLYSMHGPVLSGDLDDSVRCQVRAALLSAVKSRARRVAPISTSLLLDPVLSAQDFRNWRDLADSNGFKTRTKWTYLVNLPQTIEELERRLRPERRTKIRKAERADMSFSSATSMDALRAYYDLRCQTSMRNGLPLVSFQHFADTLAAMSNRAMFYVFLAEQGDRIGAGQLAFVHNGYVHLAGVSVANWARAERVPANEFLQWRLLRWAIDHDCRIVDFVGADPETNNDRQKSIDSFKASWGTELTPTLELTYQPLPMRRLALAAMRRLRVKGL